MVIVSEKSIRRIVEDVAPRVQKLTGWDLQMDSLEVRIISRSQYWEQGITPAYSGLGIEIEAKTEKGKKAVQMGKFFMPYLILAQYVPINGALLIMPDNLRFGTNESGLAVTLGHELTHRGQFINHPKFKNLYSSLIKRTVGINAFDDDGFEEESAKKYLQAYMTLVEGDASFTEEQLKKMFYQDAKNKTSRLSNILSLTMLLASMGNGSGKNGLLEKAKQYSRGKKVVEGIYERGGRKLVSAFYGLNEDELWMFFK